MNDITNAALRQAQKNAWKAARDGSDSQVYLQKFQGA